MQARKPKRRTSPGRAAALVEVHTIVAHPTRRAVKRLDEIMHDERADTFARIRAAKALLDIAWGEPEQEVILHISVPLADQQPGGRDSRRGTATSGARR
jgi:hypothetical protein